MTAARPLREPMTLDRARTLAVLTVDDVADLLGVHPNTVTRRRSEIPGRIAGLGAVVRYRSAVVVAWLAGETITSGPKRTR